MPQRVGEARKVSMLQKQCAKITEGKLNKKI